MSRGIPSQGSGGGEHTQVRWKKGGREREGPMSDLYTCLVMSTCLARQPCRTVGVGATRMPRQPSRWLYANGLVSVAALSHHMQWQDKGRLSCHPIWRNKMGYPIKINFELGHFLKFL